MGFWRDRKDPTLPKKVTGTFPRRIVKCSCLVFVSNFRILSLSRTNGCGHPLGLDSHLKLTGSGRRHRTLTFESTQAAQWQSAVICPQRICAGGPSPPDSCHADHGLHAQGANYVIKMCDKLERGVWWSVSQEGAYLKGRQAV